MNNPLVACFIFSFKTKMYICLRFIIFLQKPSKVSKQNALICSKTGKEYAINDLRWKSEADAPLNIHYHYSCYNYPTFLCFSCPYLNKDNLINPQLDEVRQYLKIVYFYLRVGSKRFFCDLRFT